MAKGNNQKFLPDLLPDGTIVEVAKYNKKNGEFVGLKLMTHGEAKKMEKQSGYRYQEFQKGFSQFKLK